MLSIPRSRASSPPRRGTLRAVLHQEHRGDGAVCRTGPDGDSLSVGGVQGGLRGQEVQGEGDLSLSVFSLPSEIFLRRLTGKIRPKGQ